MNGVQYKVGETQGTGAELGALRAGGFEKARIDTTNAGRLTYTSNRDNYATSQAAVVPVRANGQTTTSKHFDPDNPVAKIAWGSGAISATDFAGSSITLECTSCHNPHGNGQYRILNPIPGDGTATGSFPEALTGATVTDLLEPGRLHNYTVIQKRSTTATFGTSGSSLGSVTVEGGESGYLLYADQVASAYAATVGDYFHKVVPWNGVTDYAAQAADPAHLAAPTVVNRMNDAPNGHPTTFDGQINQWCSQCHTRYLATGTTPYKVDSGDGIYTYRHSNTSNKPCTTCHVAHGSNAQMGGQYSSLFPYPNSTSGTPNLSASSRLLKFDNRGTCEACHDPTTKVGTGTWYPVAAPTPVVP